MTYIEEYYSKIQSGELVVSKRVAAVYKRLVDELHNPIEGWVFDEKKGLHVISFIENFCRHSKGQDAGHKVQLELWQKAMLQAAFGFVSAETGLRRYRQVFWCCGRKNGKSFLSACIMIYLAFEEPGSETYIVSTSFQQSQIIFSEIQNIISQSPELRDLCKKRKYDIWIPHNKGLIAALSSGDGRMDGKNCSGCAMDELHAWEKQNLVDVILQSMSFRSQPMCFISTTSGFVRDGVYDNMKRYADSVADGSVQDFSLLPVIYEIDEKSEMFDVKAWYKANPALEGQGHIKKMSDMVGKLHRIKNGASHEVASFLCKELNYPQNGSNIFLQYEHIKACQVDKIDLSQFYGSFFCGGADLSRVGDLTGAAAIIYNPNDKKYYVLSKGFMPSNGFDERVREEKIPYDIWAQKGFIEVTEGASVDYNRVLQWFLDLVKMGIQPAYIGVDNWNARYFLDSLDNAGFRTETVRQGAQTLSNPLKEMQCSFAAAEFVYDNPALAWCLTNMSVIEDTNGNIKPNKGNTRKHKIDIAAAMLDAWTVLQNHKQEIELL